MQAEVVMGVGQPVEFAEVDGLILTARDGPGEAVEIVEGRVDFCGGYATIGQ